ncbi:MAG: activator of HSP90 ATPase, partial [Chryseobacterium sp.]|nr:activator of HSP90 ATPase [Chryseobacterium sp.]
EKKDDTTTHFIMIFDPETKNTRESQKRFWDIVLSNFEKYVENAR